MHGQCKLIVDPVSGAHLGVTAPRQRLAPAIYGGNWKGADYFSYREIDLWKHTDLSRADIIKLRRQ